MVNHTKEFSIAVIAHAVEKCRFEGSPEKNIAKVLGVDASNIPNYKSGEYKLSPNAISILLEKYGSPKIASGLYCNAFIHSSVDEFVNTYDNHITKEFFRRIAPILNNHLFKKELASNISDSVLQCDNNDSDDDFEFISYRKTEYTPEVVNEVLDWFISQVHNKGFKEWVEKFGIEILQQKKPPLLNELLPAWQNTRVSNNMALFIYILGEIAKLKPLKISTLNELFTTPPEDCEAQVVLTGDIVLNMQIHFPSLKTSNVISVFRSKARRDEIYLPANHLSEQLEELAGFEVQSAQIKVFLNERMQYRILVEEQILDSKRMMVIRNVRADQIVNEINKLATFYKVDTLPEIELKTAIAAKGGYIAGAEVL